MPVIGAEGFEVGSILGVEGGVVDSSEVECFAAFNTGSAAPAVHCIALVTGPGLFEGDAQFRAAFYDIGLAPIHEGAAEAHRLPVAEPDRSGHRFGKFGSAIGVNGVIPVVCGIGDFGGAGTEGVAGGEGEEEHVAVWNHGGFHARLGIMALRDGNIGAGEAAPGEEGTDAREVGALKGDLAGGADRGGPVEFAGVALPVINGEGAHLLSLREEIVKQDGGIETTGINKDGFHEFSRCRKGALGIL